MDKISFSIDNKNHEVSVKGAPPFYFGQKERLSKKGSDITFNLEWYQEGYKTSKFLDNKEFENLKNGLTKCIQRIVSSELDTRIDDFDLNNYHLKVKTNESHFKVVSKTRDLFPTDFNFPIEKIIPKFENILGFKLTDINPFDRSQQHIIVRINRPLSNDYNPPHKDIYDGMDNRKHIPQFVNFWVPICGVTPNSSLPIAPSSHLLTEDQVLRTLDGGVIEGNKYRVRMIKEWGGCNSLIRSKVDYGEVLVFSSHLIHGLAINEETDKTRVALEFRLFRK